MAQCIPLFMPGDTITVTNFGGVALTAKRAVAIKGTFSTGTDGGLIQVGYTAGARAFGVLEVDMPAVAGSISGVYREGVVPVTAGATITNGAQLEVDASGRVIPLASGQAIGLACNDTASGADCYVALY